MHTRNVLLPCLFDVDGAFALAGNDCQVERGAIMEIFGTDERTIRGIIKKCEELELIKATRNYQLTNEQVDEII